MDELDWLYFEQDLDVFFDLVSESQDKQFINAIARICERPDYCFDCDVDASKAESK